MHNDSRFWTPEMQEAADALAIVAKLEAGYWARRFNIELLPATLAPATFEAAKAEFKLAMISPLNFYRVSKSHCSRTIFRTPEANYALRFWHDMLHISLDADFSMDGERTVAYEHLRIICAKYSVPLGSTAWRLMRIDSLGQNQCMHTIGHFPVDQRRFAALALRKGIEPAIEVERMFGHLELPPDDDNGAAGACEPAA